MRKMVMMVALICLVALSGKVLLFCTILNFSK